MKINASICLIIIGVAIAANGSNAGTTIVVKNLGPSVNSADQDYAPTITANGKTLLFTSTRAGGRGGHDYWTSTQNPDSTWSAAVNAGSSINTPADEGAASLSADGQTIFFTGCNRDDGLGNCDLYQADLVGTQWTNIRNLGALVNSEDWDSQPAVSADGKTLYFTSNRPGGLGGTDIWYSTLDVNGEWTQAQNVGTPINSQGNEVSPFMAPDGVTFYFATDAAGLGGYDFDYVERNGNTWGKTYNLGAPINTADDEEFITAPASGDVVYFSSSRSGGEGQLDIWEGRFITTNGVADNPGADNTSASTPHDVLDDVAVWPNPIITENDRFVFEHLPDRCVISITSITGETIATLNHRGGTTENFREQWGRATRASSQTLFARITAPGGVSRVLQLVILATK